MCSTQEIQPCIPNLPLAMDTWDRPDNVLHCGTGHRHCGRFLSAFWKSERVWNEWRGFQSGNALLHSGRRKWQWWLWKSGSASGSVPLVLWSCPTEWGSPEHPSWPELSSHPMQGGHGAAGTDWWLQSRFCGFFALFELSELVKVSWGNPI